MDLSKPTPVWNTLNICPPTLTYNQNRGEKLLSVVGKGSGLSFTVQIAEGASEIALDQPHTVNVQGDEVSVFQFISPQGISDKQLDITATSQTNVAAYLKVSQNCKEVDVQKDPQSIDYKKESLRLSFATKGRITLSSVSIPPLTDSVSKWFIGISLKNLSGDVKRSESKSVTLKLTRSFDYSYTTPIFFLLFVSFVVGILVSIVAYYLFEESLTQVKPGEGNLVNDNPDFKISYRDLWEVIRYQWFSQGSVTYSYITGIVGALLMIGAFQFAFAKWNRMIQEGDRDNCYYNDFCYKVANHDIPFNLMISNLTYIVHGLILVVWVLILETKVNLRCKSGRTFEEAAEIKNRYSFSIGYVFSWALVFQGLFSTLYDLCPSRVAFQFDLTFMFVIAGLTVLLLYKRIEHNRCLSSENVKYIKEATNFFCSVITSFFITMYFDALSNFFFAFKIIWWPVMVYWAFRKLQFCQKNRSDELEFRLRMFLSILVFPPISFVNCKLVSWFSDSVPTSLYLVNSCIVYIRIVQAGFKEKLPKRKWQCARCNHDKGTLQALFIFLTVIIFVAAFWVFQWLPTNKTSSPENSRDKNEECVILEFFDWHDLWHFLSSFSLLMGAFVVMFISFEPEQSPQAEALRKKKGITGSNVREIRARRKREKIAETPAYEEYTLLYFREKIAETLAYVQYTLLYFREKIAETLAYEEYTLLYFREKIAETLAYVEYTLLYFRDLASHVLLYRRTFTLKTICRLSLVWPLPLVMTTLLVGATHDKVEGQFEIKNGSIGEI